MIKFDSRKSLMSFATHFFVLNIFVCAIVLLRFVLEHPAQINTASVLFTLFTIFGHSAYLMLLPFFIQLILVLILPIRRFIIPVCALVSSVCVLMLIIDSFVYDLYRSHVNIVLFKMITSPARNQIFEFSAVEWFTLAAVFVGVFVLELLIAAFVWKVLMRKTKSLYRSYVVVFCVVSLLISNIMYSVANATGYQAILIAADSIPYYYGLTAKRFFVRHDMFVKQIKQQSFAALRSSSKGLGYPKHSLVYSANHKLLNVIVIGVDTLRADMLAKPYMPNSFGFSKKSIVFDNHFSSGNCTSAGLFGLFYGIPDSYWNQAYNSRTNPALFEALQHYNYNIKIFMSASLLAPAFYRTTFSHISNLRLNTPGDSSWSRDKRITDDAVNYIGHAAKSKQPFFTFLFYDSVHAAEHPPGFATPFKPYAVIDHLGLLKNVDPTKYFNNYKNAVFYDDSLIKRILDKIKSEGLLRNTIVIITSDHGEEFNDNHQGFWGHNGNFTAAQTKVPFVIYIPGKKHAVINYQTTHYDMTPFLLKYIAGVTNATRDYSIGSSLFVNKKKPFMIIGSYSHIGLVNTAEKRITTIGHAGMYEITNLHAVPEPSYKINYMNLAKAYKLMGYYN